MTNQTERTYLLADIAEMLECEAGVTLLRRQPHQVLLSYGALAIAVTARPSTLVARVDDGAMFEWELRVSLDDGTAGADEFLVQQILNLLRGMPESMSHPMGTDSAPVGTECVCAAQYLGSAIHEVGCPRA